MLNNLNKKQSQFGEVRIIAGKWRSRKIKVLDLPGLRPTTDRVRETVFNWLQYDIHNSHCLDACAGSGALGFEALSRGAASVHFVERELNAVKLLQSNSKSLIDSEKQTAHIHHCAIADFLAKPNSSGQPFDVVFVDPPFELNLHDEIFSALQNESWLAKGALIYCEMPSKNMAELPFSWEWARQKKLKNVSFGLITV